MKPFASKEGVKIFLTVDLGTKTLGFLVSGILLEIAIQSWKLLCPLEPKPEFVLYNCPTLAALIVSVNDDRTNKPLFNNLTGQALSTGAAPVWSGSAYTPFSFCGPEVQPGAASPWCSRVVLWGSSLQLRQHHTTGFSFYLPCLLADGFKTLWMLVALASDFYHDFFYSAAHLSWMSMCFISLP